MFNAPDSAVGKRAKCPTCGGVIDIQAGPAPQEVLEAEPAQASTFVDEELEVEPPAQLPAKPVERKPCPMCGEMIQKDAVKCRFCGEIFDPTLRARQPGGESDDTLSAVDWVVAILAGGVGCIVAIIYMVQGKPKGTKMLLASLIVPGFFMVFYAILIVIAIMAGGLK
jgi:predicted RNA-binding Zn-ribbon protein involved in translation (DUF1610 family)